LLTALPSETSHRDIKRIDRVVKPCSPTGPGVTRKAFSPILVHF
jgi:hypothetical protein